MCNVSLRVRGEAPGQCGASSPWLSAGYCAATQNGVAAQSNFQRPAGRIHLCGRTAALSLSIELGTRRNARYSLGERKHLNFTKSEQTRT